MQTRWLAPLLVALQGCSSSNLAEDAGLDATIDASDDGSDDVAAPSDAATDAGMGTDALVVDASGCPHAAEAGAMKCNTLPTPTKVPVGCLANPTPPSGGALADGLYLLTQADWDATNVDGGCPANQTHGGAIEICGNVIEWFDLDTVNSTFNGAFVFSAGATQLQLAQFCPGAATPYSVGYTSNGTDLVLSLTYPNGPTLVMHLTRQ